MDQTTEKPHLMLLLMLQEKILRVILIMPFSEQKNFPNQTITKMCKWFYT